MSDGELRTLRQGGSAISVDPFGRLANGKPVQCYSLRSDALEARIIPYGGRIVSLRVPDRNGHLGDVVLGFDDLDGYTSDNPYFGALIGRYANRIAQGRFDLHGRCHELIRNDGEHCLHGGDGFDHRLWSARLDGPMLVLSYQSPEGEGGFPGTLIARVRYSIIGSSLRVDYQAICNRSTVVNLTNHTYFNLADNVAAGGDVLGHQLMIRASRFLPVDDTLIPTGIAEEVAGTPFDFRQPQLIGRQIDASHDQLAHGRGYDHCWSLDRSRSKALESVARVYEPASGRVMEVLTTEPGVQFYSGNFLDGTLRGRGGVAYGRHAGFCLEPQHFPDSPNRPDFPSTVLIPGAVFRSTSVYRFSVAATSSIEASSS